LAQNPWLVLFPSLALCLFLLSLNFIGDRLRTYFDVSEVKL
jgi:ABC-type dipeptide/oligopeptide/nickel transport system permease subunit